jgi:hypothetical protein
MADHQRKLIRHKVTEILRAAQTDCGEKWHPSRARGIWPNELPAGLVYTLDEEATGAKDTAPRELKRTISLSVEFARKGESDQGAKELAGAATLDGLMDDIAHQVEQALFADDTLGGMAADCYLTRTTFGIDIEGDEVIMTGRMAFAVEYYTYAPESQYLDDFVTGHQDYDIAAENVDGTVDAADTTTLPQQ